MSDDTMVCVHCMSPVNLLGRCPYCKEASVKMAQVDYEGYLSLLTTLGVMTEDLDRQVAIESFCRNNEDSRFTAGQIRNLLKPFTYDTRRLIAGRALLGFAVDPSLLGSVLSVFSFPETRRAYRAMVQTHSGVRLSWWADPFDFVAAEVKEAAWMWWVGGTITAVMVLTLALLLQQR